jgi:hypothetical protein
MATNRRRFLGMAALLPAFLLIVPAAGQGSTPITAESQPAGVLAQVSVDALPSPHAEVWFLRCMLEPDGSLPLDVQIGPTVIVVESGELTLVTDQPVEIDGAAPMATPMAGDGIYETIASAGQVACVHEDTALAMRNDGNAPVSMLALLTFSPERETETMNQQPSGTPPEPVGFTQMPIGLTAAEFPEGPGTITIERVVLDPNATARTDVPGGAIAGGVEQGSVTVTVDSGNGFVWQDMMQPLGPQGGSRPPRRADVVAGDSGDLVANDSFGFWNAGVGWQAGDDGATILQVRIEPLATATPVS